MGFLFLIIMFNYKLFSCMYPIGLAFCVENQLMYLTTNNMNQRSLGKAMEKKNTNL